MNNSRYSFFSAFVAGIYGNHLCSASILASKLQESDCATFTAQEAKAALPHEECWCDKGCGVHPDSSAQRVTVMTAIREQRLAYAQKKPAKRARSV